jgi:hypothetical protein
MVSGFGTGMLSVGFDCFVVLHDIKNAIPQTNLNIPLFLQII